jgi:Ca-activated chloride channel family protein
MFQFASPAYLLLLLLLPPVLWLHLRQRGRAVPHPSLALFAGLAVGRSRLARFGGLVLRLLALAMLAVALAGPRWPDLRTRLDTEGIAIVMVLDASGSMDTRDFDWNGETISRFEAVRRVFELFVAGSTPGERLPDGSPGRLEGRPGDLVGLVTFGTRPEVTCPPTLSHATLLRLLRDEQPRIQTGESETNISDAVVLGLARLRAAGPRRKALILLTDGEHNQTTTRSEWSPEQTARLAADLPDRIPIYAIDAGREVPAEGDTPGSSGAETRARAVETLTRMAAVSGGRYFEARDTPALLRACREIDQKERTPIASFQYRRYHEAYPWCALASFVLFVLALALERTLWRQLP